MYMWENILKQDKETYVSEIMDLKKDVERIANAIDERVLKEMKKLRTFKPNTEFTVKLDQIKEVKEALENILEMDLF